MVEQHSRSIQQIYRVSIQYMNTVVYGGGTHLLQVNRLLLLCFLSSPLWEGALNLCSRLSSLKVLSASSSLNSGLRVSASGVWKLPGGGRGTAC